MRFYKLGKIDRKDKHIYSCWDKEDVKYSWVIWFLVLARRKELGLKLIQNADALVDLENGIRVAATSEVFYKSEGYKILQRIYNSWSNFAPAAIEIDKKVKAGEIDEIRGFAFAVRTIIWADFDYAKKHKDESLVKRRYMETIEVNNIFHDWLKV